MELGQRTAHGGIEDASPIGELAALSCEGLQGLFRPLYRFDWQYLVLLDKQYHRGLVRKKNPRTRSQQRTSKSPTRFQARLPFPLLSAISLPLSRF